MKISKTVNYEVLFHVKEYQETEGGMIVTTFQSNIDSLEKAIHFLELARASNKNDWIIEVEVKTLINGK